MVPSETEKNLLVQDVVSTGKEAKILKEHFISISETIQTLQKQTKQLSDVFKSLSEHKLPHNSISTVLKHSSDGYSQENHILQDLTTKFGYDLVKDLNRFQRNWKLVKTATKQYSKATFKHKIKKAVVGNNENQNIHQQYQDEKGKDILDKQINSTLDELFEVAEDTAFANIVWHSKALQAWSKVYEQMAKLEKSGPRNNTDRQRSEGPSDFEDVSDDEEKKVDE